MNKRRDTALGGIEHWNEALSQSDVLNAAFHQDNTRPGAWYLWELGFHPPTHCQFYYNVRVQRSRFKKINGCVSQCICLITLQKSIFGFVQNAQIQMIGSSF